MPEQSIYLWPEKPLITPDREVVKDQRIYFVDNPNITPFFAKGPNGAAVIIFPGGGYTRLGFFNEGRDIADWFTSRGVSVFVVKYRMQEYGFPPGLLTRGHVKHFWVIILRESHVDFFRSFKLHLSSVDDNYHTALAQEINSNYEKYRDREIDFSWWDFLKSRDISPDW